MSIDFRAYPPIRALCVPKIKDREAVVMQSSPNPSEQAVTVKKMICSYQFEEWPAPLIAPKQKPRQSFNQTQNHIPVRRADCVVIVPNVESQKLSSISLDTM